MPHEHTLAAYEAAEGMGADALECDVRLTPDGHLVCVHDPRIDRTSTGRGRVSSKTLTDLMGHDFGSWWSLDQNAELGLSEDEAPDFDQEVQGILTLDRLLELVTSADHNLELAIETKHPTRFGGYLEQTVVQVVERYGLLPNRGERSRVRVMSFASIAMRRMRESAPAVPLVYLLEKPPRLSRATLPAGAKLAGPSIELLKEQPQLAQRWHDQGIGIHVWTIDTYADLREALNHRAQAVITNRPNRIREWLDDLLG